MLGEFMAWMVTPASRLARSQGYLAESIAIIARERRCRVAWASHLAASREALLASAHACRRRRIALVLGSGPLLDVPLAELSALFDAVWLVDIVHPLRARWQARCYANARLITHDVSESLAGFPTRPALPSRFLDTPAIDWVASVNLLSQLPVLALRRQAGGLQNWLERERLEYGTALMDQHLDYLARFTAPVCLLADQVQTVFARDGGLVEQRDYRPMLGGWQRDAEWGWDVAPAGELAGGGWSRHQVGAFSRWPSAG